MPELFILTGSVSVAVEDDAAFMLNIPPWLDYAAPNDT